MSQISYVFHMEPASQRDYKTRNILTLEERVQVIREYEQNPVYQRLAEKYNCSSKQIKNIIVNKEAVILYSSNRLADGSNTEERRQRQQKIAFLGKVIYEYVQRAVYHGLSTLSAINVRQKALEVKESIAIMNFYPNTVWLQNFKTQYQLPDFELMTLRQSMFLNEAKEKSLKAVDIIQYVSRREKEEESKENEEEQQEKEEKEEELQQPKLKKSKTNHDVDVENVAEVSHVGEPTVAYEEDDIDFLENNHDDEDEIAYEQPPPSPRALSAVIKQEKKSSAATFPDISSYEQALPHLRVLEEYAMLGDNYRAIGLITQLQQVLKKT